MSARRSLCVFFLSSTLWAQTTTPPPSQRIEALLQKHGIKDGGVSMVFAHHETGKTLYEKNPTLALNPASTIKLLISNMSLDVLGPNHRFETKVYTQGQDLCLQGGGDPSLVQETLFLLAEDTLRFGSRQIPGKLVVDDSLFPQSLPYDQSFSGDADRAFVGKISALSVNFNAITLIAKPTKLGHVAQVSADPMFDFIDIHNQTRTQNRGVRGDFQASVSARKDGLRVTTSGPINLSSDRTVIYRSVPDPTLYAGYIFKEFFERAGGKISGGVAKGRCEAKGPALATLSSRALSHIVEDLNKFSNNFIAEMLLRALMRHFNTDSPETLATTWLKERSLSLPSLVLDNASGLSRKNRISARDLLKLIQFGFAHPRFGPEFVSSFPIGATDGTMKRRLKGHPRATHVRAKSGSLSSVNSLAGMLHSPQHGWILFAMLFNHQAKSYSQLLALQDDILSLWL